MAYTHNSNHDHNMSQRQLFKILMQTAITFKRMYITVIFFYYVGICNTVGRVLSGCLSLIPNVSVLLINNVCITLSGVAVLVTPFCTTFLTMVISIAAYGLFACKLQNKGNSGESK